MLRTLLRRSFAQNSLIEGTITKAKGDDDALSKHRLAHFFARLDPVADDARPRRDQLSVRSPLPALRRPSRHRQGEFLSTSALSLLQ
jgi:hypothetical protein